MVIRRLMVNVGQPKAQGSCLAPKTDFWRHRDSEGKYPPTLKDRQLGAGPKFQLAASSVTRTSLGPCPRTESPQKSGPGQESQQARDIWDSVPDFNRSRSHPEQVPNLRGTPNSLAVFYVHTLLSRTCLSSLYCAIQPALIRIFGSSREVDKNYPNETYQGTIRLNEWTRTHFAT